MRKNEFNQHTQCLMEEKYQNDTCINDWNEYTGILWLMNEIQWIVGKRLW